MATDTEFVKATREKISVYEASIRQLTAMREDLICACDRIEEQQKVVTEFIIKAEETLK